MTLNEFPNCCSALVISGFDNYGPDRPKRDRILQIIKEQIEYYLEDNDLEYPTTFFATTRSDTQSLWEDALREIGFKACKFRSRHDGPGKKTLNFWSLYSIPKAIKPWVQERTRKVKRTMKENPW